MEVQPGGRTKKGGEFWGQPNTIDRTTALIKDLGKKQRQARDDSYFGSIVLLCKVLKLREPVRELAFHPKRRWRFDFAWIQEKIAVEIEGGIFSRRRLGHSSGSGISKDMQKYNEAAILGWRVLRVMPEELDNGVAADLLERIFNPSES